MAKLLDKFIGIMGFADDEYEDEIIDEDTKKEEDKEEVRTTTNRKGAQVVSIHTQKQVKVMVVEPNSFDDSQSIADHLKNRRPVVVNLENTDVKLAEKIVDFASGATYALGGSLQKVGNRIFLFVPSNVDIAADTRESFHGGKSFFWQDAKS